MVSFEHAPPYARQLLPVRIRDLGLSLDRSPVANLVRHLYDELEAQQIPGDTLAERATRGESVRLLTAHRSKGLEWDVVVVAGVQEETWPDLRMRGSLLGVDELAEAASGPGQDASADVDAALLAAKLLAEERRLFYVAVTRAKSKLVVTAP